jgi:hypothetical protein
MYFLYILYSVQYNYVTILISISFPSKPRTDRPHPIALNAAPRARIFKLLKSPGIDSKESITPIYVA